MAHILLVISGGIAAYKSLDVVRLFRRRGHTVTPVMTASAKEFVTPLSLEVLSGAKVYDQLFDPTQESTIGHIALARSADLVVCCPATAHLMARMAQGMADDLATTLLLATRAPILLAPAMNVRMWEHPATQQNLRLLQARGVHSVGPDEGEMACGEYGYGRLSPPEVLVSAAEHILTPSHALKGRRVLVTAGPTVEPIDPVRFISNHSSGRQGYAIAAALARYGADVQLISGPVALPPPSGVTCTHVQTAEQMKEACFAALPADVAICVAAVSDWRPKKVNTTKTKKEEGAAPPTIECVENPDILRALCQEAAPRPTLIIGFAAETDHLREHAQVKRRKKGCDWLLANDVSKHAFGSAQNQLHFFSDKEEETWPEMSKEELSVKLVEKIASFFAH